MADPVGATRKEVVERLEAMMMDAVSSPAHIGICTSGELLSALITVGFHGLMAAKAMGTPQSELADILHKIELQVLDAPKAVM